MSCNRYETFAFSQVAAAFLSYWSRVKVVRTSVPEDLKVVLIDREQSQIDAAKTRLEFWYKEMPGKRCTAT